MANRGWQQLANTIRKLQEVPKSAAITASLAIHEIIQESFDGGLDPYGNPWAALSDATMARGRNPPPLTHTRELRDSITVAPGANGIEVTVDDDVSVFHQTGTKWMPQRQIVPQTGMPKRWSDAIGEAVEAETKKVMGG